MRGPVGPRAAGRFARALDAPADTDPRTGELVALAHRLQTLPVDAAPDPEFRARLRQRLVATGSVQETDGSSRIPQPRVPIGERLAARSRRGQRRLVIAAGALGVVVVVGGLAVVEAGRALPGDTLYGLKRTTEGVQVSLAGSAAAKGRAHLAIARTRADEVHQLIARDAGSAAPGEAVASGGGIDGRDAGLIRSTLGDMDRQTRKGVRLVTTVAVHGNDPAALSTLGSWSGQQSGDIGDSLGRLSGRTADRAEASISLLRRVSARVTALRGDLSCSCLDAQGTDQLGPLPCGPCEPQSRPTSPVPPGSSSSSPAGSSGSGSSGPPTGSTGTAGRTPGTGSGTSGSAAPPSGSAPPSRLPGDPSGPPGPEPTLPPAPTPTLPPAPTPTKIPPTGILPTGILPTGIVPSGILPTGIIPTGILPSLFGG